MRRTVLIGAVSTIAAAVLAGGPAALAATAASGAANHSGARAHRPAAEHIPAAVGYVRIAYRDTQDASAKRTVVLTGNRAHRLIDLFNALKRERRDAVHCLAMGSAHTTVTFKGSQHRWAATQAICTGLSVTRDGDAEPTLVPTDDWNQALTHYLGHSPVGS